MEREIAPRFIFCKIFLHSANTRPRLCVYRVKGTGGMHMDTIMMEQMLARYWNVMEEGALLDDRSGFKTSMPWDRRWRRWTWQRR